MYNWVTVLAFKLISLLQAASLRERYYSALDRINTLETAIEDIERINKSDSPDTNRLIAYICQRVRNE